MCFFCGIEFFYTKKINKRERKWWRTDVGIYLRWSNRYKLSTSSWRLQQQLLWKDFKKKKKKNLDKASTSFNGFPTLSAWENLYIIRPTFPRHSNICYAFFFWWPFSFECRLDDSIEINIKWRGWIINSFQKEKKTFFG